MSNSERAAIAALVDGAWHQDQTRQREDARQIESNVSTWRIVSTSKRSHEVRTSHGWSVISNV